MFEVKASSLPQWKLFVMLQVGQVSLRLAPTASSLKTLVRSNSAALEIKPTTIKNTDHMQGRLENCILGTKRLQKDPILEEKVDLPQRHGKGDTRSKEAFFK